MEGEGMSDEGIKESRRMVNALLMITRGYYAL